MAQLFALQDAKRLGLPGRTSLELVSGERGSSMATVRLVDIAVAAPGEAPRKPHVHLGFEECIHVLAGSGITYTSTGSHVLTTGDTLLVPAGEPHVTQNSGSTVLRLLCFFPTGDVAGGTKDLAEF